MPEDIVGFLILGVVAGLMSGMFGIGGGAVIVPTLILLFGYGVTQATATSLGVLIWPVTVFAVIAYYRAGQIRIRAALLIASGLIVGGYFGARIALSLPGGTLKMIYGFFLVYVGWRFVEPRKLFDQYVRKLPPPPPPPEREAIAIWYAELGVGLLAGVASGLFGIGGGLVIVPALIALMHYSHKQAVGTSLTALLPPVQIGALIEYYNAGLVQVGVALSIAVTLVIGALGGARIALGLPSGTIKRLYGVFLFVVSLRFIFGL